MKRNFLLFALAFLFAVASAGVALADTTAQSSGTPNVIISDDTRTNQVVGDIIILEAQRQDLLSVETIDPAEIPNGVNDLVYTQRPGAPLYLGAGCNGNNFRFYIDILTPGVSWDYNAAPAGAFPSLPVARVGMMPGSSFTTFNTYTPMEYFPALFRAVPLAQVVYGTIISEFIYYGAAIFPLGQNSGSFCYEYGQAVAVRNDDDATSAYRSRYDVVVGALTGSRLVVDVIKPAFTGLGDHGIIRIPGSIFRVQTSGTASGTLEEQPILVSISYDNNDFGNTGVTEVAQLQIGNLVSQDNPGSGAGGQVQRDGTLRDVIIGGSNQQASNLVISEQVGDQFQPADGNSGQLTITLAAGVQFFAPPRLSFSGGIEATLVGTAYPARVITLNVEDSDGNPGTAGTIRVHDIHVDVAATVPAGNIMATVAPTVNGNNVQTLRGLDTGSAAIARAVPGTVVDESGSTVNAVVSVSSGALLVRVAAAPTVETTGNLYVSFAAPTYPGLENAVYFRPADNRVPTADGLYVTLVSVDGGVTWVPEVASDWYEQSTFSTTKEDLWFYIGGLSSDFVGQTLVVTSWIQDTANGQAFPGTAIQTVNVRFVD